MINIEEKLINIPHLSTRPRMVLIFFTIVFPTYEFVLKPPGLHDVGRFPNHITINRQ